jgi:hypothetical protein
MAADDHAIVIGISRYPFLEDLSGPENDARAVIDWLKDPEGGDVPAKQIYSVTSACFQDDPRPGSDDVYDAFDPVIKLGEHCDPHPAGRRLYIFMAGHGFGPSLREASLLMANAARRRYGHNVCGAKVADHFGQARYFREIVLLMDCCRERLPRVNAGLLPWDPVDGEGHSPRLLYGYAAHDSRRARERPYEGEQRGLFTVALLEALRAGANSSSELRDLVKRRMIELMGPDSYHKPEFQLSEEELEFGARAELPTLTVTLGHAPGPVLVTVERDPGEPPAAKETLSSGDSLELRLEPGIYRIHRHDGASPVNVALTVESKHVEI